MKTYQLFLLLAVTCLLGCKENSGTRATTRYVSPEAGQELTVFHIGMSEEAVQDAIRMIPNFRRPDDTRPLINRLGEDEALLLAQPWQFDEGRPREMQFSFNAHKLDQAKLTYELKDKDSQSNMYDRVRDYFIGNYTETTNHILERGGRAIWMLSKENTLVLFESRANEYELVLRMDKPTTE
jgi:hypothetical protein